MTQDAPPLDLHPDVYEPAEDTELLLRVIAEQEPDLDGQRALDVGTGTGVISRALAARGARTVAVDLNPHATRIARLNTRGRVDIVRGDLATALRGPFDVVTFNAPYLPSAPEERVEGWLDHAFHGGDTGIETSVRLIHDLPRLLAPGGRAYLVVSSRADLARLEAEAHEACLKHESLAATRFFFEEVSVWRLGRIYDRQTG